MIDDSRYYDIRSTHPDEDILVQLGCRIAPILSNVGFKSVPGLSEPCATSFGGCNEGMSHVYEANGEGGIILRLGRNNVIRNRGAVEVDATLTYIGVPKSLMHRVNSVLDEAAARGDFARVQ